MNEYKKYYWNRNAATHRDALIKFGWFAFFPAGVLAMGISLAIQPIERTPEVYRLSAVVLVITFVVVYAIVFGLFTWVYWALNEGQYKPYDPPTPKEPRRIIKFYANGSRQPYKVDWGEGER